MSTEAVNLFNPSISLPIERVKKTTFFEWFFILMGALPLYLPFLFLLGERGLSGQNPIYWYFWITAIFSSPHVYSTYYRLNRKIKENKIGFAVGWPAYFLIVFGLILAQLNGFFLQAMTAVNVIQSYHYLRQVYGTYRLLGRSQTESKNEMSLSFYAFHLAVPLFVFGRWDTLYTVWGGKASTAIIPVDFSAAFMDFCFALAIVAIIFAVVLEVIKFKNSPQSYNPVGAVILCTYFLIHWFGFLSVEYYQRGFFAVTIFHAIQYFGLLWYMEWKSDTKTLISNIKNIPFALAFPLIWGVVFILGFTFENKIVSLGNFFFPSLATILLGAVSAHHYFVDAFMWRRQAGK